MLLSTNFYILKHRKLKIARQNRQSANIRKKLIAKAEQKQATLAGMKRAARLRGEEGTWLTTNRLKYVTADSEAGLHCSIILHTSCLILWDFLVYVWYVFILNSHAELAVALFWYFNGYWLMIDLECSDFTIMIS